MLTSLTDVRGLLNERFRCPEDLIADFSVSGHLPSGFGYFRFGSDIICYGQCSSGLPASRVTDTLHDAGNHVVVADSAVHLPFDPTDVVDNLRHERYVASSAGRMKSILSHNTGRRLYYRARPFMPIAFRKHLQRLYLRRWDKVPFPTWPVDCTVENLVERLMVLSMKSQGLKRLPFVWFWPDGARCCTMMTHDVETSFGVSFCPQLMDLNDSFGIKSAFEVVPEGRYRVREAYLQNIRDRGFEVNVHDLNHDGLLFSDRHEFLRRAERINSYGQQFRALGFRSAVLYRNANWCNALDFSYDMSIPNVAHLDPQRGGCCTVLPFSIGKILELPVTTTQDYSLFHILNDYSIRLWRTQISLIREKHGLISFIIHPDYLIDKAARQVYTELLEYLSDLRSAQETWMALPREVAAWWQVRSQLNVVRKGALWRIEGPGNERARIAYASLGDNSLRYELEPEA